MAYNIPDGYNGWNHDDDCGIDDIVDEVYDEFINGDLGYLEEIFPSDEEWEEYESGKDPDWIDAQFEAYWKEHSDEIIEYYLEMKRESYGEYLADQAADYDPYF